MDFVSLGEISDGGPSSRASGQSLTEHSIRVIRWLYSAMLRIAGFVKFLIKVVSIKGSGREEKGGHPRNGTL
jgi:hypothetical protein